MNAKKWKLLRKLCKVANLKYDLWKQIVDGMSLKQREQFFADAKKNVPLMVK